MEKKIIIDSNDMGSVYSLRDIISKEIKSAVINGKTIVILCIGTDRSTGDSLGPLVGDKLKFLIRDKVYLYGTLEEPVHAKNLEEITKIIHSKFRNPFIIAIDACLGNIQNVGKICVENKPLTPGAAMNKNLPPIGDLSITGIVNISGSLEFMVLQNTRLHTVMILADIISRGIYHSIIQTLGGRKTPNSNLSLSNFNI